MVLYDPGAQKLLRDWIETETLPETKTVYLSGKSSQVAVQRPFRLGYGPVPSKDGSRLFAMSEDDAIFWDSNTLEELNRWDLPEPPEGYGGLGSQCFFPAPDGRGMWFLGKSGKVYRPDDHTGTLIEEVKFPFRLISLIREP
jgi:hypothetical protein